MKKLLALVLCATMTLSLAGCGEKATEDVIVTTTTEEPTAEELTVEEAAEQPEKEVEEEPADEIIVEEPEVVEEPVEEDTSNLSDEEWFKSLNLNTATFLVFNSVTGERAVLEDGQDYVVKEGDRIAEWYPLDWKFKDLYPIRTDGVQFDCVFLNMNALEKSYEYEEKLIVIDTDGNEITVTLNLIVE